MRKDRLLTLLRRRIVASSRPLLSSLVQFYPEVRAILTFRLATPHDMLSCLHSTASLTEPSLLGTPYVCSRSAVVIEVAVCHKWWRFSYSRCDSFNIFVRLLSTHGPMRRVLHQYISGVAMYVDAPRVPHASSCSWYVDCRRDTGSSITSMVSRSIRWKHVNTRSFCYYITDCVYHITKLWRKLPSYTVQQS